MSQPPPSRTTPSLLLALAGGLAATPAAAQETVPAVTGVDSYNLQTQPQSGPWVARPALPTGDDAGVGAGIFAAYTATPLAFEPADGGDAVPLVEDVGTADLRGWWRGDRFAVGVGLPVHGWTTGASAVSDSPLAAGNLRLAGQASIVEVGPTRFGATAAVTAPTGADGRALGAPAPTMGAALAMNTGGGRWSATADLGAVTGPGDRAVSDLAPGPAVTFGAGVGFQALPQLVLAMEAQGRGWLSLPDAAVPIELLGGARVQGDGPWAVHAAAGAGVTEGIGAPAFRALLGVAWQAPRRAAPEPQPELAEAPPAASDDEPTPGRLSLTLRDDAGNATKAQVQIVNNEMDRRFVAKDGALTLELPPGSYAVYLRADGRVPVDRALTVESGETVLLDAVLTTARVQIQGDRVVLSERIFFETGSHVIQRRSFPLLNEVAATLEQHPELEQVAIRGHADARGDDAFNQRLSQTRAEAVRNYLVQSGVQPHRLLAVGLGEDQPLVLGDTAEALAANRRVEFLITVRNLDLAAGRNP